ncbi:phospholipase D-like domain-containing protein [Anaeromyxobacter terrae]|uniref:phospholipase D-like domain-containing protein n=1 Tax=Anaeromyxobacter terrae TaxID=2925406 RepID=UPI001F578A9D|nr:phospholipase D-like domain-containing protein [Anaeromyxobacter sp. SG22]
MTRPQGSSVLPAARGAGGAPGGRRAGGAALRFVAEHAFTRAAGAPLVPGNAVRLLRDAGENFPAWQDAIAAARESVFFEAYIFADDRVGRQFAELLAEKARAGVRVRVLHDWLGGLGEASPRFWRRLSDAGVEVRTFNPPRLDSPIGWMGRDHRKSVVVDGRVGFVTGLCVAERWAGDAARGAEPWRDTGVEVRGPAVADLARAFAQVWDEAGAPLPDEELPDAAGIAAAGEVALRVVASEPATSGVFRLDQLVAAMARRSLWITDAYFVGTAAYVQGLRAAAHDGVDVRLLVPGDSDLGLVKRLSVAGYRPLLEAGVRIFEWNGPMLHAKTAVADGRWGRVGSSNLNLSSWLANWELDVAIEDEGFAQRMEDAYEEDLGRATEIVLDARRRVQPVRPVPRQRRPRPPGRGRRREGSAVAAAGALRIGNAVGAALGGYRVLGPTEARLLAVAAVVLLALGAVGVLWPRVTATPLAFLCGWLGVALVVRAWRLRRRGGQYGRTAVERSAEEAAAARRVLARAAEPGPAAEPARADAGRDARA